MTLARTVAVITPAFRAQDTLLTTVKSVLDQTHGDWQHFIIADDGFDYAAFLAEHGLGDSRQVFLSSGGTGTGASRTRNVALEQIEAPYAAILDADDRLKPQKLERAVEALQRHAIVTTALDVMTMEFAHLRHVGMGEDQALTPGEHGSQLRAGDEQQQQKPELVHRAEHDGRRAARGEQPVVRAWRDRTEQRWAEYEAAEDLADSAWLPPPGKQRTTHVRREQQRREREQ